LSGRCRSNSSLSWLVLRMSPVSTTSLPGRLAHRSSSAVGGGTWPKITTSMPSNNKASVMFSPTKPVPPVRRMDIVLLRQHRRGIDAPTDDHRRPHLEFRQAVGVRCVRYQLARAFDLDASPDGRTHVGLLEERAALRGSACHGLTGGDLDFLVAQHDGHLATDGDRLRDAANQGAT